MRKEKTVKDPDLAGTQFEVETKEGSIIDIVVIPKPYYYELEVTDRETKMDVKEVLTDKDLPKIKTTNDLNIALQILFADFDDPPQVTEDIQIADWERGRGPSSLNMSELTSYVSDVNSIVLDLQETTLHTAIDRSGRDVFFRYGDVVVKTSFRYSPVKED